MSSDRKYPQNRNQELGAISRDLKNLAGELDIPIIGLSQLNRNADEKTEPALADLRDSGELEQNASKVIFLWQINRLTDGTKEVGVSVAKNRRGRTGAVKMEFDGSHMNFQEISNLQQSEQKQRRNSKYGAGVFPE